MPKQIEFARPFTSPGTDLLNVINDILDLSKIESGTVMVDPRKSRFCLQRHCGTFLPACREIPQPRFPNDDRLPTAPQLATDVKRLLQILKNLLSNAFKFTPHGHVSFSINVAPVGWSSDHHMLKRAPQVIAFNVTDTVLIITRQQKIIFEAFQQADAGTSRKYGGTGLGLAISRELARLLGGEIRLSSVPRIGGAFMLYLPHSKTAPAAVTKSEACPNFTLVVPTPTWTKCPMTVNHAAG